MKTLKYYMDDKVYGFEPFCDWNRVSIYEKVEMIKNTTMYHFLIKCAIWCVWMLGLTSLLQEVQSVALRTTNILTFITFGAIVIKVILLRLELNKCNLDTFFSD